MQTHENAPQVLQQNVTVKSGRIIGWNQNIRSLNSHKTYLRRYFDGTLGFPIVSVRSESHAPGLELFAAAICRACSGAQGQVTGLYLRGEIYWFAKQVNGHRSVVSLETRD
jgi:hypothetical protein